MRKSQSIGQVVRDNLLTSGQSTSKLPQNPSATSTLCRSQQTGQAVQGDIAVLRIRYPTLKSFMADNSPSRQLELCHYPERCVFGSSPTLSKLNMAYGKFSAEKWLSPQIVEISLIMGLKESATAEQVRFTVSAIAMLYPWLKTDELMLFFFRFKAGYYEQFYSRFDPQILLRSLKMFMEDRASYYRIRDQKKLEKELEDAIRNSITYEKYKSLKKNKNEK